MRINEATIAPGWCEEKNLTPSSRWTIINKQKCHYASGKAVGYALAVRGACTELLAKADSWAAKRAAFATKALWVARDADDDKRVWPAGRYVPQTQENPKDSVLSWCQGNESVDGEDIVIFLTTGINHIPRPEVWFPLRFGFFKPTFL
jgi:primary-amine oxidase